MEEHYRKLERMYLKKAPIQSFYKGTNMVVGLETAEIILPIKPEFFHAANAVHGSVYFRLLDDSAFFAANSVVPDVFVLTASFNIHLLRPVDRGILTATGKVKFISKNLVIAESELFNEDGKKIAFGTGNFMRSRIALTPEIGYE